MQFESIFPLTFNRDSIVTSLFNAASLTTTEWIGRELFDFLADIVPDYPLGQTGYDNVGRK